MQRANAVQSLHLFQSYYILKFVSNLGSIDMEVMHRDTNSTRERTCHAKTLSSVKQSFSINFNFE